MLAMAVMFWTFVCLSILGGAVIDGRWDLVPQILIGYITTPILLAVSATLFCIVFVVALLIGSVSVFVSGEARKVAFEKFPR